MDNPTAPSDWLKVDGIDELVELALNLHWSWNHAADQLWEALDKDLWATTQNPWVILRTVSRERIKDALGTPEFRQKLDSLLQQNRDSYRADAWFQHKHPGNTLSSLLNSGWRRVHIVTDHGWLLLPGGLPRIDLPHYLVETKWARCAVVKGQPDLPVPVSIWYWNPAIRIASPPGIGSFRANETYAHGGISPQECVVPDLLVERGVAASSAKITSIEWRRMRCRIRVETNNPSVRVDLRKNWKEQATSIVAARKALDANGEASLVLDDTHEGAAASVVVLDVDGNVIAHQTTCVGEKA